MATMSLNPSYEGRRDNGLTVKDILPSKTGLDDKRLNMVDFAMWRCDSVCMGPTPAHGSSTPSLLKVRLHRTSTVVGASKLSSDYPLDLDVLHRHFCRHDRIKYLTNIVTVLHSIKSQGLRACN